MPELVAVRPNKGLVLDLPAWEVGDKFWTVGDNVHFRNAFAERAPGQTSVYATIQENLRSLMNIDIGGVNYWIYNGDSKQYAVQGSTHTDVTHAALTTDTDPNIWTVGSINGIPFANNGADAGMYWDGNILNNFVDLTGWTASDVAYSMRAFKFFLIAIGLSETAGAAQPDVVKWSNSAGAGALPSTWTAGAANDAGAIATSETKGKLIDGAQLGGSFILYKQHAAHQMDWIGGNDVMSVRPILHQVGVLTRNCIALYRNQHILFTDGDVVSFDGHSVRSVIDAKMRKFIFNQIDQSNYKSSFVTPYPRRNEIWVCFPSSGNTYPDIAAVYDADSGSWGVRDIPSISCAGLGFVTPSTVSPLWTDQTDAWSDVGGVAWGELGVNQEAEESLVLGQPDDSTPTSSLFLEVDSGDDFNGTDISSKVGKHSMPLGNPYQVKTVSKIMPRISANAGVTVEVRVGTQMDVGEAISWQANQTFTVGTTLALDVMATGRFISVEISSLGGLSWSASGFDIMFRAGGFT